MTNEFIYLVIGGAGLGIFLASISRLDFPGRSSRREGPPWPPVPKPPVVEVVLSADGETDEAEPDDQREMTAEQKAVAAKEEKEAESNAQHERAVAAQAELRKKAHKLHLKGYLE